MTDEQLMRLLRSSFRHLRRQNPSHPLSAIAPEGGTPKTAENTQNGENTQFSPPARPRGMGHILDVLTPGVAVSQQTVADAVGIRPQSVSEALSLLEAEGMIVRTPAADDRRVTEVRITEKGIEHREKLRAERIARAEVFFAPLSDEEKETLFRLLTKLNEPYEGGTTK